jgi:hypothetical protein
MWYDLDSGVAGCEFSAICRRELPVAIQALKCAAGYDNDCNGGIDDPWPIGEPAKVWASAAPETYICATKTTVKCSSEQWPPNGQMFRTGATARTTTATALRMKVTKSANHAP